LGSRAPPLMILNAKTAVSFARIFDLRRRLNVENFERMAVGLIVRQARHAENAV
jgi:hypothetical protein